MSVPCCGVPHFPREINGLASDLSVEYHGVSQVSITFCCHDCGQKAYRLGPRRGRKSGLRFQRTQVECRMDGVAVIELLTSLVAQYSHSVTSKSVVSIFTICHQPMSVEIAVDFRESINVL